MEKHVNTALSELPELIEWHEGMLLTPQHFQELASRSELLTHFLHSEVGTYPWGVLDLKIDQAAIGNGVLRILNLEALMPDGLLALGGSERGMELEFDFGKVTADRVRVHLAVPRERGLYNRTNYGRYQGLAPNGDLVQDGVSRGAPASIPRIQPRFKLAANESELAGMTTIPLIEFSRKGTVLTPTSYIPPLLRVLEGSPLAELCAPLRNQIRSKAVEMARNIGPSARNSNAAELLQLQWLVSALPVLEAMLSSGRVHPFSLYLALCLVAGNVAQFSHGRVPPVFHPYAHNDLYASFQEVLRYVSFSIAEGLVDYWIGKELTPVRAKSGGLGVLEPVLQFELVPGMAEVFGEKADFSAPFLGLVLRAPAGIPPRAFVEWGETCLLANEDLIPDLELSRSLGAVCEVVDSLDELTATSETVLFRVRNEPKWLDPGKPVIVKPARQEKHMPAEVSLYVKKQISRDQGR